MIDLRQIFRHAWQSLRQLSGDDAYERYLEHWHSEHHDESAPMDRATFYKEKLDRRWKGVKRCC